MKNYNDLKTLFLAFLRMSNQKTSDVTELQESQNLISQKKPDEKAEAARNSDQQGETQCAFVDEKATPDQQSSQSNEQRQIDARGSSGNASNDLQQETTQITTITPSDQPIAAYEEENETNRKRKEYFQFSKKCKCSKIWSCLKKCEWCKSRNIKELLMFTVEKKLYIEKKSSIISSLLRKNEDDKFWNDNSLDEIMGTYLEDNDASLKDFFSILMYDWHESEKKSNENYLLSKKFRAFENAAKIFKSSNEQQDQQLNTSNEQQDQQSNTSNDSHPGIPGPSSPATIYSETIFEKLFKVISKENLKHYHDTCLKIIYYYVDERMNNLKTSDLDGFNSEISDVIKKVLEIQNNDEYKIKILKVLIIFLENDNDSKTKNSIYEFLKAQTSSDSVDQKKTNYDAMIDHCDRLFFNLVFFLKEDLIPVFKDEFKNYIKLYKQYYGDYWTYALKENGRLLYLLTKIHKLNECGMFISMKTPESKLKSSITSLFTDVAEFHVVFNEPLDNNDTEKLVKS